MICTKRGRIIACGLFLVASTSYASIAIAQSSAQESAASQPEQASSVTALSDPPSIDAPPVRSPTDSNGVNLATGGFQYSSTDITIGTPGAGGLAHQRVWTGNGWRHNYFLTITQTSTGMLVSIGTRSYKFTLASGAYTSDEGDGSTLVTDPLGYKFTLADGTVVTFDTSFSGRNYYGTVAGLGRWIDLPSKERIALYYKTGPNNVVRLQSVNSSSGYQLKYGYNVDFFTITQIISVNNAIDYCDPNADSCSGFTQTWPKVEYATATVGGNRQESVTDIAGNVKGYTINAASRLIGLKPPSSTSDNIIINYQSNGMVSSVSNGGRVWTYDWNYSEDQKSLTAIITDPLMNVRSTTAYTETQVIGLEQDALNRLSVFIYDSKGRMTYAVPPEGTIVSGTPTAGYTKYEYDTRGNVWCTMQVSKTASTPQTCAFPSTADKIVTMASFPASCSNPLVCNKPESTTNARGLVTDYTYDSTTGFVTSVTSPPPGTGAVRPQTRYSYSTLYGFYKQSAGGSPTQAPTPIVKLTATSACITTASCTGGADEVKTTINYGPQTSGTLNNLLPMSVSSGSGNGTLTATATNVYDMIGNLYTVDGPLTGSADTIRYRYDAVRRLTGIVASDPDGSLPLKSKAQRFTYNANGQVTVSEVGTVNGQFDSDWANFASYQQLTSTYDPVTALKTKEVLTASVPPATPASYQVVQYSYDALGRPLCQALRMSGTASPTDACSQPSPAPAVADRIARTVYNNIGQVVAQQSAYGVTTANGFPATLQRDEVTNSYTANGNVATATDAKGNKTSYEYDGFDRVSKTRYPSPTTPGTSSTTDYVEPTYTFTNEVVLLRLRDGQSMGFGYDNLGRMTSKDYTPGGAADVTYGYDNLNRMTSASQTGNALSFTYDALNRNLTQSGPLGTVTSTWDLAGRRTRLDLPGGFFTTYDYHVNGAMWAIRESGAASGVGVTYLSYDDLGRRTNITRGNGTVTYYDYDPVSRLSQLNQDFPSAASDQVSGYSYNAASQITSRWATNDSYAMRQQYNANRGYTANGLNQYLTAGSVSPTYDGRGNLTGQGTANYSYNLDNLLTSATVSGTTTSLAYDPALRLYQTGGTRFLYDGTNLVAEYDGAGNVLKRYVHGPGTDEPLIWYEGSGTGDRKWLHADERGSVIATSDGSGNTIGINAYDEWGNPQSGNIGRFGYTGQTWLPEIGMWYYKARMYSPRLGRFMQTDPIGYGDGMNLYAYVRNDPVNITDPFGLAGIVVTSCGGGAAPAYNDTGALTACYIQDLDRLLGFGSGANNASGSGGGSGRAPGKGVTPQSDIPDCSALQRGGQAAGKYLSKLGSDVTRSGIGIGTAGVGVAGAGAATLQPEVVVAGGVIAEGGAAVTFGGGVISTGGALLSVLSGGGKPAVVRLTAQLITDRIPGISGLTKSYVKQGITAGLNAIIPDIDSCRNTGR